MPSEIAERAVEYAITASEEAKQLASRSSPEDGSPPSRD
jgi:hypothetical protein